MYKISIYNYGFENVIHYPSASKETPHIMASDLQEKLSQADNLTLTIPYNNSGYNSSKELSTKVKVSKISDNTIVFTGRILNIKDGMSSSGEFTKECICESALGYMNDSHSRRTTYTNQNPTAILTSLLARHNATVDSTRQIQLGIIQLTQNITISYNYETVLNAIIKIRNILGGDLLVRETGGVLFLDYLMQQGSNNGVQIRLGHNQKSLINEYNAADIITRLIPLGYGSGINQLDITSVNSGLDYIDNIDAKAKYGVIEGQGTNADIQDAGTLKIWGTTQLSENSQPALSVSCDMLDLSTIGIDNPLDLGDTAEIINNVMNFDVFARVIEKATDLLAPYNPKIVINTKPIKLSDNVVSLKQRTLSLENAPQGNTYIDTFGYAENIDSTHPFTLPIWISPDIIFINRVRLHIDGQRYRGYEVGSDAPIRTDENTYYTAQEVAVANTPHMHQYGLVAHVHSTKYGIIEDDMSIPFNCIVKINGVEIAGPFYDLFSQDIDITSYINTPGETYQLEVSNDKNARVNVWVSIQAFIQAK